MGFLKVEVVDEIGEKGVHGGDDGLEDVCGVYLETELECGGYVT